MADKRTRRRFTPEFKAQAVKRVLDGRGVSEVATELGRAVPCDTTRARLIAESAKEVS